MKTVKPVSKETYERIGKAYAICSEYPDVFGDVTFRKFCDMFVDDIIDDGEEFVAARKKAYAGEMYDLLEEMAFVMYRGASCIDTEWCKEYATKMFDIIERIKPWKNEDADDE